MKGIFLLFLFYVNVTYGQFTYSSSDHFSIGQNIEYEVSNLVNPSIDFSLSGENMTWDFSDINALSKDTLSFIDPNVSGYKTSYCFTNLFLFNCQSKFDELTNIGVRSADSLGFGEIKTENIVRHYKLSSDMYSETMLGITAEVNGISVPVGFDFEQADIYLKFPFTYESRDSSESRLVIDLNAAGVDAKISRNRTRVNAVVGYGNLTTPAGTYNEVLMMKTSISNRDSTQINMQMIPISTEEVEYKWFAKGFTGPVMIASGLKVGGNVIMGEVRYQKEAEISSLSNIDLKTEITISPNPYTDIVNIEMRNREIHSIHIYNTTGALVFSAQPSSSNYVLSEPLSKGIYLVRITTREGDFLMRKVIKL